MPREIEVKFEVDNLRLVKGRLLKLGAALLWKGAESSVYYDHPVLRLREKGIVLRLRKWPGHSATVTYKSKNIPENKEDNGDYKIREELQTTVTDLDTLARILEGMGFTQTLSYKKAREHWLFGKIFVELDDLEGQLFVEVEGTKDGIQKAAGLLGLDWSRTTTKSYTDILAEKIKK